jgi:hypothetical protein
MLPFSISGNGCGSPESDAAEAQKPIIAIDNDVATGVQSVEAARTASLRGITEAF